MSIYKKMLDSMVWSYSRLNAYEYCPYSWYLRYIENKDGIGSFYADNGKAMHSVLESVTNGSISVYDAPSLYLEKFEEIDNKVKKSIMDKTFDLCIEYLFGLDEDTLNGYEVVGSEIKVNYKIGKYKFIGFIDLLLRDSDGNLIVVDHKSTDRFLKKDGNVRASTKEMYEGYKKQIYLYAEAVYQKFGEYPNKLVFNHFKDGGHLTVIQFDIEENEKVKQWAIDTIKKIYKDKQFIAIPKSGFCWRLCGYRDTCEYKFEDEEE